MMAAPQMTFINHGSSKMTIQGTHNVVINGTADPRRVPPPQAAPASMNLSAVSMMFVNHGKSDTIVQGIGNYVVQDPRKNNEDACVGCSRGGERCACNARPVQETDLQSHGSDASNVSLRMSQPEAELGEPAEDRSAYGASLVTGSTWKNN